MGPRRVTFIPGRDDHVQVVMAAALTELERILSRRDIHLVCDLEDRLEACVAINAGGNPSNENKLANPFLACRTDGTGQI